MDIKNFIIQCKGTWSIQQTINYINNKKIENLQQSFICTENFNRNKNSFIIEWKKSSISKYSWSYEIIFDESRQIGYVKKNQNNSSTKKNIAILDLRDEKTVKVYTRFKGLDIEENLNLINSGLCISSSRIKIAGNLISTSFKSAIKIK
uniref:Uncharacterized protein n=1 Tax=Flintiella sanguinaria TaxID=101926 RepID=A0A1X9PUJ1_9RHOD|nr:hypothetical protein [Flintiella sanguinaria]